MPRAAAERLFRLERFVPLPASSTFVPVRRFGGEHGFYFADILWRIRAWADWLLGGIGMGNRRTTPSEPIVGDAINMWNVESYEPGRSLLLRANMRLPGRGWLRFDVNPDGEGSRLCMTVRFVPRGLLGEIYWWSFYLPHELLFRGMMRNMARMASRAHLADARARAAHSKADDEAVFIRPRQAEKRPPCQAGCPAGNDVRSWVNVVAQRRVLGLTDQQAYARAWRTIVEVNPFPAITGRICPHPCESGCNRHDRDGSLSVHQMERFLGDWALEQRLPLNRLEEDPKPESIGVIGSGPAGMSFAYQMARRGYPVTVYEGNERPGGMLQYGIPQYRLPDDVVDAEFARILDLGVELRLGTRIGQELKIEELSARHQAVFLGIGAQQGRKLEIPGETGPGTWTGVDYLARVHRGEAPELGEKVVVIGGGDTAIDSARVARRTGADVRIVYRRGPEEMPAEPSEIEAARLEGISIDCLVAPVRFVRREDRLEGLVLRRMRLGAPGDDGRRKPEPIDGSEFDLPATAIISAVAQSPDWRGLEQLSGGRDWARPDDTGQIDGGWWAGGDVEGAGIASLAIARGRLAAESLHARLRGLELPTERTDKPIDQGPVKPEFGRGPARAEPRQRPVQDWLTRPEEEISLGLTEEAFLAEAGRCLSCGDCIGCEQCWMYCAHGCFSKLKEVQPGAYFSLSLDHCQACGKCIDVCPCGYLEVRPPLTEPDDARE